VFSSDSVCPYLMVLKSFLSYVAFHCILLSVYVGSYFIFAGTYIVFHLGAHLSCFITICDVAFVLGLSSDISCIDKSIFNLLSSFLRTDLFISLLL
jgi:hypothetical protein